MAPPAFARFAGYGSASRTSLRKAKRKKAVAPKLRSSEGGLTEAALKYVYILQSTSDEQHFYTGLTDDLRARLQKHNAGEVSHTSKFNPRRVKTYLVFSDTERAIAYEKYLKSPSGRAFAKKRL